MTSISEKQVNQQENCLEEDKIPVSFWRPLFGFIILGSFVVILYLYTLYQAWLLHLLVGGLVAVILVGILIALYLEGNALKRIACEPVPVIQALKIFTSLVIGACATYWISTQLILGPVVASALVGLVGAMILPRYSDAIYCGSFVGMSEAVLLVSLPELLLAGSICGVVYILAKDVLGGLGGKLGTVAFTGVTLVSLRFQTDFLLSPCPEFEFAEQIIFLAVVAAVLTYWLSSALKNGPVLASCTVGLMGGLVLPAIFPDTGQMLAIVVICASFTGMSSAARFSSPLPMLAAGLITGIIFLYSTPVFVGAGGKLGTVAFGSSLAVWGLIQGYRLITGGGNSQA